MRKAVFLGLLLNLFAIVGVSQDIISIGMAGGSSHYLGDFNKTNPFFSPSPGFGAIVKNDLSLRTSLKFTFYYEQLNASVSDFRYLNAGANQSFNTSFLDMSVSLEYNFLPYEAYNIKKYNFSPFVFAGIGTDYFFDSEKINFPITIPFGLGIKYNIFERFSIGFEWSARKLFVDSMDDFTNVQDPVNDPKIHNNDWYHMAFIFFTFKPFRKKINCPAYDE